MLQRQLLQWRRGVERKGRRREGRSAARGDCGGTRFSPTLPTGPRHRPGAACQRCEVTFARGQTRGTSSRPLPGAALARTAAGAAPQIPASPPFLPGYNPKGAISAAARRAPPPPRTHPRRSGPGEPLRGPSGPGIAHLHREPVPAAPRASEAAAALARAGRAAGGGVRRAGGRAGGRWRSLGGSRRSRRSRRRRRRRTTPALRSGQVHPPPGRSAAAAADHFRGAGERGGADWAGTSCPRAERRASGVPELKNNGWEERGAGRPPPLGPSALPVGRPSSGFLAPGEVKSPPRGPGVAAGVAAVPGSRRRVATSLSLFLGTRRGILGEAGERGGRHLGSHGGQPPSSRACEGTGLPRASLVFSRAAGRIPGGG